MITKILLPTDENLNLAAEALRRGELIAMPTETVYGLAANALNEQAVSNIFRAKGRPNDNPLIVHIAHAADANALCHVTADAKLLMEMFWPGPLTLLLKKKPIIPAAVNAGLDTVAIRMPQHTIARELIARSGCPIAAPSANLSGKPSPTSAEHVYDDFQGKIPYIIDGGTCAVGLESTVLHMAEKPYKILRPGGVTLEALREIFPDIALSGSLLSPLQKGERAESPGMLYQHYSPDATVILLKGKIPNIAAYYAERLHEAENIGQHIRMLCFAEHQKFFPAQTCVSIGSIQRREHFAKNLFRLLRALDKEGVDIIYSEVSELDGIGMAIMNRLMRAAAFQVVDTDAVVLNENKQKELS